MGGGIEILKSFMHSKNIQTISISVFPSIFTQIDIIYKSKDVGEKNQRENLTVSSVQSFSLQFPLEILIDTQEIGSE